MSRADQRWSITNTTHHFWLVSSAMKSSRLSNGRSREQSPHRPPFNNDTQCPRMRKTSIRLAWDEETPGEAPGCASIFSHRSRGRADHRHPSSKRNNAGATPAGSTNFLFPRNVKAAFPFVKRCVVVRVHAGEPFQRSASGQSRKLSRKQLHLHRCPGCKSLALRHFKNAKVPKFINQTESAFHSSKAEPPADNR